MTLLQPDVDTRIDDAAILVVDDLKSSRMMIGAILSSAGFTNVEFATDGVESIDKLKSGAFDIVILDIVMPRMDGFDVCRIVRRALRLDLPILVQSSLSNTDQKVRAFDVGASDIVAKPVDAGELVSRVRLHLDRRRLVQRLQRYQTRMDAELRAAESMQVSLLKTPETVGRIADRYGMKIETLYRPSNQLGGDLWDLIEIDDDRLGVLLVDLSGHGVSAAINAFRLHMLVAQLSEYYAQPDQFLSALNRQLSAIVSVEHFATVFYGVIDQERGRFFYASGGAPAPVWFSGKALPRALGNGGALVGCSPQLEYETYAEDLSDGAGMLFYSDALYERFSAPETSLSTEELLELADCAWREVKPGKRLDWIRSAAFGGETIKLRDDLTMVSVDWA